VTDRYALYGLVVDSEVPLHQDRPAPAGASPDVVVRLGEPVPKAAEPEGELLLHFRVDEFGYALVRDGDGYLFRVLGSCDFRISADLRDVSYHPAEGGDDIGSVLVTGALLALELYLRGLPVLHASAVDVGDRAIGFVGQSGRGKSTMATLLCRDGGRLITDDVLRVDHLDTVPRARLGATELRLRKGADALSSELGQAVRRTSVDGREIVSLPDDAQDGLPLAALVIPTPTRDGTPARVDRVGEREATFALLNFPRLLGWRDPVRVQQGFAHAAALARSVPVLHAQIPWGPPFPPEVAALVRAAVAEHADEVSPR
jgi:hypothetical protein